MTVLPRKGEINEAKDVLNERLKAAFDISAPGDHARSGVEDLALAFGDLFDTEEMQGHAEVFAVHVIEDMLRGRYPVGPGLMAAFRQGAALGVMTERRRWEAQERERRRAA